jgi:MFS family permease
MALQLRFNEAGFSGPVRRVFTHAVLVGIGLSITEILMPFYLVSLGYTTSEVGLFSTVARLAGMLSALPLGRMVDRIGPQRALQIAVTGSSTGWALLLLAPTLPLMLAAQFVIGMLGLLVFTTATPLLASLSERRHRSQIFAVNEFMYVFVGLIGSAIGGALPAWIALLAAESATSPTAYRLSLAIGALIFAAALLPVLAQLRGPVEQIEHVRADEPTAALPLRRMLHLALGAHLIGLSSGMVVPFQGLFLREQFGVSDATVGLIVSATALSAGVGALTGAAVVRRIGIRRGAGYLRMMMAPALAMLLIPNLSFVVAGLILRAGFISASVPQADAMVISQTPARQRGRMAAVSSLLWSGGWAVSSLAAGYAAPQFGYGPQFAVAMVLGLLSGLAYLSIRESH